MDILLTTMLFDEIFPLPGMWTWPLITGTFSALFAMWCCWGDRFIFTSVVMSFLAGAASPQLTCGLLGLMKISHMILDEQIKERNRKEQEKLHTRKH